MKQILFSVSALLALIATPVLAGKRIEMQATDLATSKVTPHQILLDADRMRVDMGNTAVMFMSKGGNRVLILDKGRNEYRELTQADIDQLMQQLNAAADMLKNIPPAQRAQVEAMMKGRLGAAAATASPTTFTAKGGATVNGFPCTNYDGMQGAQKVAEICAAQPSAIKITPADFQVMEKMQEMFKGLATSPMANLIPATGITQSGINGFPIQSTNFKNGQPATREELKSVTDATFSDADFSVGAAQKMEMPSLGGRGKGK